MASGTRKKQRMKQFLTRGILSSDEESTYHLRKQQKEVVSLRIALLALGFLYGSFALLDLVLIREYLSLFLVIRFCIVIPLDFVIFWLTFRNLSYVAMQFATAILLIVGGLGIAVMLILYPENFSYYGGLFLIIFSGYFLLKLDIQLAFFSGMTIILLYLMGFFIYHHQIEMNAWLFSTFFLSANIIGAIGNMQINRMGRQHFKQELEIHGKNQLLESRVLLQHDELIQVKKAIDSASDAVAIYQPDGTMTYHNFAFEQMFDMHLKQQKLTITQFGDIVTQVVNGKNYIGEHSLTKQPNHKIIIQLQADAVIDEDQKTIGVVATYRDITARKLAEENLEFISYHDQLTGLLNRSWFDIANKDLEKAEQLPLSLIMGDLNGLKLINDTYGHAMGDRFLQRAADIIRHACRKDDFIVRWGGDEFVVLLPQTEYARAVQIIDKIVQECRQVQFENLPVSIALGIATKQIPEDNLAEVLKVAEDAMYRQKLTESRSVKSAVLNAMLQLLHEKNLEVEEYAALRLKTVKTFGNFLELSSKELSHLELLTRIHDIGRINFPDGLLTKTEPLTLEDWAIIQKHPEVGYRITQATEEFSHISKEILSHHERWDGTGYPQKTVAEEIPYLSRIVAIVDAYEMMKNGRPYKKPMAEEDILSELQRCAGSQFDPNLVDEFIHMQNLLSQG